jgi:DNA-binding XRE family transcriptional regulator
MLQNEVQKWRLLKNGKGVSRAHLARQIRVCRSYVTKLEQGKIQPSGEVMFKIAAYLERPIEDIFRYEKGGE